MNSCPRPLLCVGAKNKIEKKSKGIFLGETGWASDGLHTTDHQRRQDKWIMQIKTPASFQWQLLLADQWKGRQISVRQSTITRSNEQHTRLQNLFCRVDQNTSFRQIQMSKYDMEIQMTKKISNFCTNKVEITGNRRDFFNLHIQGSDIRENVRTKQMHIIREESARSVLRNQSQHRIEKRKMHTEATVHRSISM